MSTDVLAPCPGRLMPVGDIPDPVFAGEMVGPGLGIDPDRGPTTVVAPIAGKVVKIHPHAFVVLSDDGVGVLVHLGLNTVRLEGAGFEVLAEEGSSVAVGDPMVRWDPSTLPASSHGEELSPVVPVVVMDRPKGSVEPPEDRHVEAGELLFTVPGQGLSATS